MIFEDDQQHRLNTSCQKGYITSSRISRNQNMVTMDIPPLSTVFLSTPALNSPYKDIKGKERDQAVQAFNPGKAADLYPRTRRLNPGLQGPVATQQLMASSKRRQKHCLVFGERCQYGHT